MAPLCVYLVVFTQLCSCFVSLALVDGAGNMGQPTGLQFAVEIPAEGLAENEQHEVDLQGGDRLQIVDKSKTATIQPSEINTHAYEYDRSTGTCDTENRLVYQKAFSLAPADYVFWAITNAPSRSLVETTYVFTAPSGDQLKDPVSFCFLLQVKAGTGTSVKPASGLASLRKHVHSTKLRTLDRTERARHRGDDETPDYHLSAPLVQSSEQPGVLEEKKKIVVIVHSGGSSRFLSGAVIGVLVGPWLFN